MKNTVDRQDNVIDYLSVLIQNHILKISLIICVPLFIAGLYFKAESPMLAGPLFLFGVVGIFFGSLSRIVMNSLENQKGSMGVVELRTFQLKKSSPQVASVVAQSKNAGTRRKVS